MVQLGLWSVHEDLEIIRRKVPREFAESLQAAAADVVATPPLDDDAERRRDLTHLMALAID